MLSSLRLVAGWFTLFAIGTDLFVVSPLMQSLSDDFHVTVSQAGLAVTAFAVVYVIAAPAFGYLADRVGRRSVLTLCLIGFAGGNVMTAMADGLPGMLIARAACGLFAAGVTPSIYALTGASAPAERRGIWVAIVLTGLLTSLPFGAPLGLVITRSVGWPAVFAALAIAGCLLALLNYFVWRGIAPAARAAHADPAGPGPMILARRLMPTVAWSAGLYGMYTYLPSVLAMRGYGTADISVVIFVYGAAGFTGALLGGRIADRLGAALTIRASLISLAACFTLLLIAMHEGRGIVPALGLTALSAQAFFPAQQSLLIGQFSRQASSVLAWNNSALFLGMTIGSSAGGQVLALGGLEAVLIVSAIVAIAGWAIAGWAEALVSPSRPSVATAA